MKIKASDWNDLIESKKVGALEDDEMTAVLWAGRVGIKERSASNQLLEMYKNGQVGRRWIFVNGKKVYAYRILPKSKK